MLLICPHSNGEPDLVKVNDLPDATQLTGDELRFSLHSQTLESKLLAAAPVHVFISNSRSFFFFFQVAILCSSIACFCIHFSGFYSGAFEQTLNKSTKVNIFKVKYTQ